MSFFRCPLFLIPFFVDTFHVYKNNMAGFCRHKKRAALSCSKICLDCERISLSVDCFQRIRFKCCKTFSVSRLLYFLQEFFQRCIREHSIIDKIYYDFFSIAVCQFNQIQKYCVNIFCYVTSEISVWVLSALFERC